MAGIIATITAGVVTYHLTEGLNTSSSTPPSNYPTQQPNYPNTPPTIFLANYCDVPNPQQILYSCSVPPGTQSGSICYCYNTYTGDTDSGIAH